MPAILILGFDLEITRVMLVGVLGGLLGILMMIPLRRALIVKEHGVLKYPEGTACAAVLIAGASEESRAAASESARADMRVAAAAGVGKLPGAKVIFTGFGVGLLYKTVHLALKGWKEAPEKEFGGVFKGGSAGIEVSPELLGVGYIIGPRIASIMCAGGVLAYLVLIPMIKFFGERVAGPLAPGTLPIADMGPNQIRGAYVLYIGAGAVAAGGIISVIRSLPTIWHGLRGGLADLKLGRGDRAAAAADVPRTDRDLSMKFVGIGTVALLAAITLATPLEMNLLGALLIVVFGFIFVTVSSRLTGEIGSSSNPISGMTVATLLLTCLIFLFIDKTGGTAYVTALSVGAIVCIAASNGGTTSQDLKTGFLVGGTPKLQQYAILVGALVSALALGPILLALNRDGVVYVPAAQVAPGLHVEAAQFAGAPTEKLEGPQAAGDTATYRAWHKTGDEGGPAGKYLLNERGEAVWLVDPGINGAFAQRPDGTTARKYTAPKATLMSYIIKGILDRQLPWALVLLGVFIAITLELAGVSSLAFAVGVYLPLSASTPIFVGGLIRWLVDRKKRHELRHSLLDEAQLAAESDKSPGVLLASGYIAGGAIAGILIALMGGLMLAQSEAIDRWSAAHNPFYAGPWSDVLALLPFGLLVGLLLLVAREKLLAPKER